MKKFNKNYLLVILLVITFIFRVFRISTPSHYIFDEVYHVVTAKAYSKNNPAPYNPFSKSPEPNTAYDWLHPPLAKLIQASSINLIGDTSFAWRLPSAVFGTLSIYALYLLSLTVTKSKNTSLLAATIFSLDNLQLTMSRITMNDIFVTTFIIMALTFFYKSLTEGQSLTGDLANGQVGTAKPEGLSLMDKPHLLLTGLFTGLALATKWSAIFLFPVFSSFLIKKIIKKPKQIIYYLIFLLILPLTIYLLSYSQYFLLNYTIKDFFALHQQIYWYQTGLTATHSYQSPAWQWPLLIKPVWFHVQYFQDKISNIYNLGNPAIFFGGLLAVTYQLAHWIRSVLEAKLRGRTLMDSTFLFLSYLFLFLPWIFSPRILFFHHYLPSLAILCLILAKTLHQNKKLLPPFLLLTTLSFLFFYPLNTAIPIPNNLVKFWFWLPTWK